MIATDKKQVVKGGGFLINETEAHEIFTPEEFSNGKAVEIMMGTNVP